MKQTTDQPLHSLNNVLTVIALTLGIYIIAVPFLPEFRWRVKQVFNKPEASKVQITSNDSSASNNSSTQPISSDTWLDVPRLSLHTPIYTSPSMSELNKGVWHIPGTSTPDKDGNTVVAGHRFTYTNPQGVFYFLDKLQINDRVTVDWRGTEYTYKVTKVFVVPPSDTSASAPTKVNTFTMYTCTPLLTAKNRLIVQAELVSKRTS